MFLLKCCSVAHPIAPVETSPLDAERAGGGEALPAADADPSDPLGVEVDGASAIDSRTRSSPAAPPALEDGAGALLMPAHGHGVSRIASSEIVPVADEREVDENDTQYDSSDSGQLRSLKEAASSDVKKPAVFQEDSRSRRYKSVRTRVACPAIAGAGDPGCRRGAGLPATAAEAAGVFQEELHSDEVSAADTDDPLHQSSGAGSGTGSAKAASEKSQPSPSVIFQELSESFPEIFGVASSRSMDSPNNTVRAPDRGYQPDLENPEQPINRPGSGGGQRGGLATTWDYLSDIFEKGEPTGSGASPPDTGVGTTAREHAFAWCDETVPVAQSGVAVAESSTQAHLRALEQEEKLQQLEDMAHHKIQQQLQPLGQPVYRAVEEVPPYRLPLEQTSYPLEPLDGAHLVGGAHRVSGTHLPIESAPSVAGVTGADEMATGKGCDVCAHCNRRRRLLPAGLADSACKLADDNAPARPITAAEAAEAAATAAAAAAEAAAQALAAAQEAAAVAAAEAGAADATASRATMSEGVASMTCAPTRAAGTGVATLNGGRHRAMPSPAVLAAGGEPVVLVPHETADELDVEWLASVTARHGRRERYQDDRRVLPSVMEDDDGGSGDDKEAGDAGDPRRSSRTRATMTTVATMPLWSDKSRVQSGEVPVATGKQVHPSSLRDSWQNDPVLVMPVTDSKEADGAHAHAMEEERPSAAATVVDGLPARNVVADVKACEEPAESASSCRWGGSIDSPAGVPTQRTEQPHESKRGQDMNHLRPARGKEPVGVVAHAVMPASPEEVSGVPLSRGEGAKALVAESKEFEAALQRVATDRHSKVATTPSSTPVVLPAFSRPSEAGAGDPHLTAEPMRASAANGASDARPQPQVYTSQLQQPSVTLSAVRSTSGKAVGTATSDVDSDANYMRSINSISGAEYRQPEATETHHYCDTGRGGVALPDLKAPTHFERSSVEEDAALPMPSLCEAIEVAAAPAGRQVDDSAAAEATSTNFFVCRLPERKPYTSSPLKPSGQEDVISWTVVDDSPPSAVRSGGDREALSEMNSAFTFISADLDDTADSSSTASISSSRLSRLSERKAREALEERLERIARNRARREAAALNKEQYEAVVRKRGLPRSYLKRSPGTPT